MKTTIEIALLCFFIFYVAVIEPYLEQSQYSQFKKRVTQDKKAKIKLYSQGIVRNWIITLFAGVICSILNINFSSLGLKAFNFDQFIALPFLAKTLLCLLIAGYFVYFYLPVVLPHCGEKSRNYIKHKLTHAYDHMPYSNKERAYWFFSALNSCSEEFVYRGFLFVAIPLLVPQIPLILVMLIASLIDSSRYSNRLIVMLYVFISGMAFSSLYIVSGTLFIPMLAHVMNDLRPLVIPMKTFHDEIIREGMLENSHS